MYKIRRFSYILWLIFSIACSGDPPATENSSAETNQEEVNQAQQQRDSQQKTIVFFGNSLTAGYGLDPGEAFPALIEKRLDSLNKDYQVINAGLSGETTAAGVSRIDWILDQYEIDIFILELGANDGLRGVELTETRRNLSRIIEKVRQEEEGVQIVLAGMQIPPNMGPDYTTEFRKIFPELAKEKDVKLIPFLLKDVGGEKDLNLEDGIHPNEKGHKIVAENVWEILKDIV